MDCRSKAQLHRKITHGNKTSTSADTRIVWIISCLKTKQNQTGMMKNTTKLE